MASCEILCVGTELLLGQILNTNQQFISQELATLGINCFYQTTVGDNKTRIISSIRQALDRADILLITGGLGPTPDDLTTECLAEAFGVGMVLDDSVVARIQQFFQQRGYPMPESNRKQALRPVGAEILPNPIGTAPGIIWHVDNKVIMTFPGVPAEMRAMWRETAAPYLQKKYGGHTLYSVELLHYGIGESALAEKYADLLDLENPTVAPYAGTGECKLRVTARAKSTEEAKRIADPIVAQIVEGSGDLCYGRTGDTLESVLGNMLRERKLTISFAESCTGGLASKRLTDVAGSSDYTNLNVVTYSNHMKIKMLGVDEHLLNEKGAVSPECAIEMANGIRNLAEADIGVGITGVAGPSGGTEEKPVGLVYLAVSSKKGTEPKKLTLPSSLGREGIRHRSASEALNMVRLMLLHEPS